MRGVAVEDLPLRTTKTYLITPRRQRSTKKLLISLVQSAAILAAVLWLTGCSCRLECGPDINSILRAIPIILEK